MVEKIEADKILREKNETMALQKSIKREATDEYFPFTHGDYVSVKRQEEKERVKKEF